MTRGENYTQSYQFDQMIKTRIFIVVGLISVIALSKSIEGAFNYCGMDYLKHSNPHINESNSIDFEIPFVPFTNSNDYEISEQAIASLNNEKNNSVRADPKKAGSKSIGKVTKRRRQNCFGFILSFFTQAEISNDDDSEEEKVSESFSNKQRNSELIDRSKLLYFPEDLIAIVFDFLDAASLYKALRLSKIFAFKIRDLLYMKIQQSGFIINVSRNLLLPTYSAFFLEKLDYSRFSGLKGKVIDIEDFIALHIACAYDKNDVARFVPDIVGFNSEDFFNLPISAFSSKFPDYLKAFRYLSKLKFKDNRLHINAFIPYTILALENGGMCGISQFTNYFIIYYEKICFKVKILEAVIRRVSAWRRAYFVADITSNILRKEKDTKSTDKKLECLASAFDAILNSKLITENYSNIAILKSFFLYVVFNSNAAFATEPHNYLERLKSDVENFHFGDYSISWVHYFYDVTPETLLPQKLLALRYLLTTPKDNIDCKQLFINYNQPKSFEFCFEFYMDRPSEVDFDDFMKLFEYAIDNFDFSNPRLDDYRWVSSIFRFSAIDPEYFAKIMTFLREKNKSISYAGGKNNTRYRNMGKMIEKVSTYHKLL